MKTFEENQARARALKEEIENRKNGIITMKDENDNPISIEILNQELSEVLTNLYRQVRHKN